MKTLAVFSILLFALTMACGGGNAGSPGDAVTEMFDALKAGNGERAVAYMSESALSEMDSQLEMIKMAPEQSAQQLSVMGIEIDAADIPDMTTKDFMVALISSPVITSIMESTEVSIGEVTIDGNSARVEVKTVVLGGEPETNTIDVVKEDGKWKIKG